MGIDKEGDKNERRTEEDWTGGRCDCLGVLLIAAVICI